MRPRTAGALLLLVGALALAHPLYLWPHYGQTPHYASFKPADDLPEGAAAVDYENLPPAAQAAFDADRRDESRALHSDDDEAAVDALRRHEYVRQGDDRYRIALTHADDGWLFQSAARLLLSVAGAALAVLGGLTVRFESTRPLTVHRSVLLPAGGPVAVVLLGAHDALLLDSVGSGAFATSRSFAVAGVVALAPAVLGVALRRRRWRYAVLVAVPLLFASAALLSVSPLLAAALVALAAPGVAIGALFAAPPAATSCR